jgi:hypothetical protein
VCRPSGPAKKPYSQSYTRHASAATRVVRHLCHCVGGQPTHGPPVLSLTALCPCGLHLHAACAQWCRGAALEHTPVAQASSCPPAGRWLCTESWALSGGGWNHAATHTRAHRAVSTHASHASLKSTAATMTAAACCMWCGIHTQVARGHTRDYTVGGGVGTPDERGTQHMTPAIVSAQRSTPLHLPAHTLAAARPTDRSSTSLVDASRQACLMCDQLLARILAATRAHSGVLARRAQHQHHATASTMHTHSITQQPV